MKYVLVTAVFLIGASSQKQGTEIQCLGSVPHNITYDLDADTLDEIQSMKISVVPVYEREILCSDLGHVCVGVNTDTCVRAKSGFKITDSIDCPNCWLGASAEFFYDIDIHLFELKSVKVGLRNNHLRGAAEFHTKVIKEMDTVKGEIPLLTDQQTFSIGFKVAKIVPVSITLSQPTTLTYEVTARGALDLTAGAELDYNLGDHYMAWTKTGGWSPQSASPSLTVTPVLDYTLDAEATFVPGLKSSTRVTVENILTYNLDVMPSFPLTVSVDTAYPEPQICAGGAADFVLTQDASLHYTFFKKKHNFAIFGPKTIFDSEGKPSFQKCIDLPTTTTTTTTTLGPNCDSVAFAYCCSVGTPCACKKVESADGQCGSTAYDYCCHTGTPCRCEGVSAGENTTGHLVV